ncbi:unnamed protein product, partial [Amoebophrya sp. A120]
TTPTTAASPKSDDASIADDDIIAEQDAAQEEEDEEEEEPYVSSYPNWSIDTNDDTLLANKPWLTELVRRAVRIEMRIRKKEQKLHAKRREEKKIYEQKLEKRKKLLLKEFKMQFGKTDVAKEKHEEDIRMFEKKDRSSRLWEMMAKVMAKTGKRADGAALDNNGSQQNDDGDGDHDEKPGSTFDADHDDTTNPPRALQKQANGTTTNSTSNSADKDKQSQDLTPEESSIIARFDYCFLFFAVRPWHPSTATWYRALTQTEPRLDLWLQAEQVTKTLRFKWFKYIGDDHLDEKDCEKRQKQQIDQVLKKLLKEEKKMSDKNCARTADKTSSTVELEEQQSAELTLLQTVIQKQQQASYAEKSHWKQVYHYYGQFLQLLVSSDISIA